MQQHNTNGLYRTRVTVWLANRQRAKMFVGYNSTRRKKERTVRRKRKKGQNGRREETPNE